MNFSASGAYLIAGEQDARNLSFALINAEPRLLHHLSTVLAACDLADAMALVPAPVHEPSAGEDELARSFDLLEGGLRALLDGHYETAAAAQARLLDQLRPLVVPEAHASEVQGLDAAARRLAPLLGRKLDPPPPPPAETRGADRVTESSLETSLFWTAATACLVAVAVLRRHDLAPDTAGQAVGVVESWVAAFLT